MSTQEPQMRVYYDENEKEYIPLASTPSHGVYGPDNRPRLGVAPTSSFDTPKDRAIQFTIATVGVLGMIILYSFYKKS